MTRLRRFAPTAPAEYPWNRWPNARGIAGRIAVEQVAEWRGIGNRTGITGRERKGKEGKGREWSIRSARSREARVRAKPASARKTALPPDLAITPQLRAWAEGHGYGDLERHLEAFRDKATARGYQYADWEAALRNAIRDDWAKLRERGAKPATRQNRPSRIARPQAGEFADILEGKERTVIEGECAHVTH